MRRRNASVWAWALLCAPACTGADDQPAPASQDTTGGADDLGQQTTEASGNDGTADDGIETVGGDDGDDGDDADTDATTGADDDGTDTDTAGPSLSPCDFDGLQAVADVLATAEPACVAWVESVYGRVARSGAGSATVWTLSTDATTGVLLGARHTLGMQWAPGEAVAATLTDPNLTEGLLTVQFALADATAQQALAPAFHMWIPELGVRESNSLADLLPRHDYYVAAIDDQLFIELEPFPFPDALRLSPPLLVDPDGLATAAPTFAEAIAGQPALVLGHPAGAAGMEVSWGTVLSDAEAEAAIAELGDAGDDEGAIPYDAEAEILLHAEAVVGMSGGGVFDLAGRLIGVSVRATTPGAPQPYVRAVRASFIASSTQAAIDSSAPALGAAIAPHLPQL